MTDIDTSAFLQAVALVIATGVALVKAVKVEWTKRAVGLYTVLAAGFAAFLIAVAERIG